MVTQVTSTVMGSNAVSANNIADNAVVSRHIGDNVILARHVEDSVDPGIVQANLNATTANINTVTANVNSVKANVDAAEANIAGILDGAEFTGNVTMLESTRFGLSNAGPRVTSLTIGSPANILINYSSSTGGGKGGNVIIGVGNDDVGDTPYRLDVRGTANVGALSATSLSGLSTFVVSDGGSIGSASSTSAITIAADGVVTFVDDIKIKNDGTIGSAGAPTAMTIDSAGIVSFVDDIKVKNDGTIGSAGAPTAMTIDSTGIVSFVDDIKVKNDGTIGSAGAPTAMTIDSAGIVTFVDDIKIKDGGTIGTATTPTAFTIAADGDTAISGGLGIVGNTAPTATGLSIGTPANAILRTHEATGNANLIIGDATAISPYNLDVRGSANVGALTAVSLSGPTALTVSDGGTVGSATTTDAITIASDGVVTFKDDIKIKDGGTIGTATTPEAITINANGNAGLPGGLGVAGNTAPASGELVVGSPANVFIRALSSGKGGNVYIGSAGTGGATTPHALDVRGSANTGALTATTIALSADGGVQVPNDGNIGSAGATDAIQISSGGVVTFADDIIIKDGGTIGAASATTAMTIASTGIVTFVDDIIIKDAGTIGSASDADAIAIGADGDVTLTQDLELQHDGATISFGTNDEIVLEHVHDTGLLLKDTGGSPTLQLHDSGESVSSDGSKLILTSNGVTFNMPTADGDADQVLTTNGSGTLSFAAAASGATNPSVTLASNIDLGNLTDATKDAFGQGITVINDLLDMPFETTLATLDLGAL